MKKKILPFMITAQPAYVPEQSDPEHQKFVWSYEISIENNSSDIVQLLNRYWLITDMNGKAEEVRGAGVVGLQPLIKPGNKFVYTSFCQLHAPQGTMEGYYEMQNLDEQHFKIEIPRFILTAPVSVSQTSRSRLH